MRHFIKMSEEDVQRLREVCKGLPDRPPILIHGDGPAIALKQAAEARKEKE